MCLSKVTTTCLVIIVIAMGLASIHPLDWSSYLLHQAGTLIFVAIMLACYHYFAVKARSFVLASIFIVIHIIGARYLYSYVPYDNWLQQLFGFRLSDTFGWQRNMYDRFVHFNYGLLMLPLILDCFRSCLPNISIKILLLLVLQFNLASSTFYELFEWAIAVSLSPEAANAYNGQQGDMWDAHKDILLAFVGALVTTLFVLHDDHQQTGKDNHTLKLI